MAITDIKHRTRQAGFTIVELLIVIVVIAILASITVTAYNGISERSRLNSALSFQKSIERNYAQEYLFKMTFEDGLGNGASPAPTEETGNSFGRVVSAGLQTIANSEIPNNKYVYDYSQAAAGAFIRYFYNAGSSKPLPNGSFVLSYWFKPGTSTSDEEQFVLCMDCGTGTQAGSRGASRSAGYIFTYTPSFGSPTVTLNSKPYDMKKWHQFLLRYDDPTGIITLYIDGVKQDEKSTSKLIFSSGYYFDFGRSNTGQIDDLRIYAYN